MTEYIYGDVLFVINFSMDFLSLYIAGKLTHSVMRTWRVILAAVLGALYGVVSLLYSLPWFIETVIEIAAALAVCAVGLWNGRARRLLVSTAVFYAASVLLGGTMTLIYSKLGKYRSYIEMGGNVSTAMGEVPLWVFFLCAALSAVLTKLLSALLKRKNSAKACTLSLTFDGKTRELSGFIDSGNVVCEPISGMPVIFISSAFIELVPERFRSAMSGDILSAENISGLRAVPVSTAAGNSLVFAVKPERCYVKTDVDYELVSALVAIGKSGDFCGCDALVPAELAG